MLQILDRIREGEVLLCDGALGTMLIQNGLKAGECPDLWNIEKPDILENIAASYIEAGSDIVSTNTFGGHPLKLEQYGSGHRVEEINKAGVRAVRGVVEGRAFLAASCGPSGRLLKPYGDTVPEEIYEGYKRQITALVSEGVDILFFETMIDLAEVILAVKAAKDEAPGIPVAATMTFDKTPRGFFTVMGNTIEGSARELEEAGADIVGSNCGNGIDNMLLIAEEFKKHTNLPVLIQSNAGLPLVKGDTLEYPETPEFMGLRIEKMLKAGVNLVGGCCGTSPEHIRRFRAVIDRFRN